MTCSTFSVTRVCSIGDLANEWSGLLARCPGNTIFLTPEWHRTWWESAGEGELHLVTVRDGGALVGVAPLVRFGNQWEFSGGAEVADFLDIIAAPGYDREVSEAILDYLSHMGGSAALRNLRPGSIGAGAFRDAALSRGIRCWLDEEDVSPRVELSEDWESYLQSLTKKDRHELRRKLRRLLAAGAVDCVAVSSASTRSTDMQDFFRLCRLSAEEKAVFLTPQMELLFHGIVDAFTPRKWLRLYFLELDGVRIASAILFDYGGEFLLYNSGYDPAYAHLSVGLLLKAFCLRDAIAEGRRVFDFLQGSEPYKYDLGAVDVPIWRLRLDLGTVNEVVGSRKHG